MKTNSKAALLAPFLPLGLAVAAVPIVASIAADLFFHPADGTSLERRMEVYLSADLDDFEMNVMGQTMGPEEMGGDIEQMAGEVEIAFTTMDEITKAVRGRTIEMVRTFEEMTVDGEEPEGADDGPRQVRFTWSEDEGRHTIEVLDEDADDDDIEMARTMLSEDMSLRLLLPEGEVAEGDTWSVALGAEGMLNLFFPGVRLDGVPDLAERAAAEEEPEAAEFAREAVELLIASFDDSSIDVTYVGNEEVDGKQMARLDLTTEFLASFDPSDMIERAAAMDDEAPDMSASVEVVVAGNGQGHLLWNTTSNHLHSLTLEGDWTFDLEADITMTMEEMGEMPMNGIAAWSGTFRSNQTVSEQ